MGTPVPADAASPPASESEQLPPPVTVTDPGVAGSPSDQTVPRSLQGDVNVNRSNSGTRLTSSTSVFRQPMPPMPDTKTVGPKVFRGWLVANYPDLNLAPKNSIVEVKGQWDDSGHVLHLFGLLSNRISTSKLNATALDGVAVLVVDCAGEIPNAGLSAIEQFVRKGGYLLTTDWALDGCLARAIPGYVEWNGGFSRSELIDATVVDPDPDLLKGAVQRAYWKLDNKCQLVKVNRINDVDVLVRSATLSREDPNEMGVLALTFKYGKGAVLHLVGHFDSNTDGAFNNAVKDPAPGIGISLRQAIAANFVMCGLKAHVSDQSTMASDDPPEQPDAKKPTKAKTPKKDKGEDAGLHF